MSLNQAQRKAAVHRTGPCLVLAGPGSGKTTTIVNRIRFLTEECQVRPEEILVVTFTRFAATEMKSRLCSLTGRRDFPVTMGTFHGIYYGILRQVYRMGPENILSEGEKYQLLRRILAGRQIEIFDEEDFLRDLIAEIGKIKNNRLDIEEYESEKCGADTFRSIFKDFEEQRKQLRKIDFDDMLVLCHELLSSRPQVLDMWQKKFRYILVDEFQDINRIQYDVIRMLAAPEDNLFVVGDDDQAIYGFRGADSGLMFQFLRDYPGADQILLGTNYRSAGNIVRNSLKVIENNKKRFQKDLRTSREKGASVHIQEVRDPNEEAEYVAEQILKREEEGVRPEEIAVLFRIHTDARPLTEALAAKKIPFQMKEHLPNLYEHFIARDIMAYFRLGTGRGTRQDYLQVMNRPKRYIGRDSITSAQTAFEDMRRFYCDKNWMIDRIDQFEWDVKMLGKMAPYAAIQFIRKRIGYDDYLKDYAFTKKMNRADLTDILAEIEEGARPFQKIEEWFAHVEEYTKALAEREKEKSQHQEGLRLMTLHASKGLEFDTVFLIGANEGRIPYKKAQTEAETEEERRLFYVGMTRAKNLLRISYVKKKNGKDMDPSRFVEELLETETH